MIFTHITNLDGGGKGEAGLGTVGNGVRRLESDRFQNGHGRLVGCRVEVPVKISTTNRFTLGMHSEKCEARFSHGLLIGRRVEVPDNERNKYDASAYYVFSENVE